MAYVRLLFLVYLMLWPVWCQAEEDSYGYPIPGSYDATILGTPAKLIPELPKKIPIRQLVLDIIPDRQKPEIFFYDEGLRCTAAFQKQKAPLVFLIAGAGSSSAAPKLLTLLKSLYQAGYHVITLPSPSHPNFIISASQSCIPGDLNEDAADLYRAMEAAWNEIKPDIKVSDFYLGGYSLGGTQAAFVAKLDEGRKIFNFRKVLMINPSVNLYDSVMRIEELLKKIPGGPKKEGQFFNRMLARFSEFYRYGNFIAINDDFIYAVYKERLFSEEETGGLIGLTFRINLAGMIFTSDVLTNSGYVVPKNKVLENTDPVYDYFLVSTHLSFFDYFNEYFYPYFKKKRPGLSKQALIGSLDLKSIEDYLRSSTKFGVMTNRNDFILTKSDLDYLSELFRERFKLYPRGGHLGNLEYKENLAYMVDFFNGKEVPKDGRP
ncbi:MAG TPA: alpha/beta hydrolase [Desulfuromonadaceae bacterium]|jgi:hypothetical protein